MAVAVERALAMERVVAERVTAKAVGGDNSAGSAGGGDEGYTLTCPSACKLIPSCVSECPRPLTTTEPLMVSCGRWRAEVLSSTGPQAALLLGAIW